MENSIPCFSSETGRLASIPDGTKIWKYPFQVPGVCPVGIYTEVYFPSGTIHENEFHTTSERHFVWDMVKEMKK